MTQQHKHGQEDTPSSDGGSFRIGPFTVNPAQGVFDGEREIKLTPKSLALLCRLGQEPGLIISKEALFESVWHGRVVTDNALTSCIRELRIALGDDAREPRYIETIHGRGFRLRNVTGRLPEGGREMSASSGSFANAGPTIVVLPFNVIGDDNEAAVIAQGLVHDLITRIARSRALFVIARGTSFHFTARQHDVGAIGKELGVAYAIQGAIHLARGQLSVTVGLAETATRRELWSEQFTRKRRDFMRVQEDIMDQLTSCLEAEVVRNEIRKSLVIPSENLDAWSAYHRGVHHMYRFTYPDCNLAEEMFRRSIALEPGVPRPHAGLAFVHFERAFLSRGRDRLDGIEKTFEHALESLAIDPLDPMGHWALSRAYHLGGQHVDARRELDIAIDLNPSYAIAHYSLGWVGLEMGENELCRERIGFARRMSPHDPLKFAMLGVSALNLALLGEADAALPLAVESAMQSNAHNHAIAYAAVTHAIAGRINAAAEYLGRIHTTMPGYDVSDFLAVSRFQREHDIARIRAAFAAMRRRGGHGTSKGDTPP